MPPSKLVSVYEREESGVTFMDRFSMIAEGIADAVRVSAREGQFFREWLTL